MKTAMLGYLQDGLRTGRLQIHDARKAVKEVKQTLTEEQVNIFLMLQHSAGEIPKAPVFIKKGYSLNAVQILETVKELKALQLIDSSNRITEKGKQESLNQTFLMVKTFL